MIGREIDVESQKALRKVKHSCSEVIRALTLRFEEHSGIDRKIHAQLSKKGDCPPRRSQPLRAPKTARNLKKSVVQSKTFVLRSY